MAQFYQLTLGYLEEYEPAQFEALKAERALGIYVGELVDRLYAERDRILVRLKKQYASDPSVTDDQLAFEAESMAIASVLPM